MKYNTKNTVVMLICRLFRIVMGNYRNAYIYAVYNIMRGVFRWNGMLSHKPLKNRLRNNPKMKISNKNICKCLFAFASVCMWFSRWKWLHSMGKYLHESDTIMLMHSLVFQLFFSIQTYLYFVCVWVFFPSTILWNIISLICFRIFAEFPIPDTVNANAKAYSAIYIMNITVFSTPKEIQLSFVKIIIVSKLFLWTIVPNLSADNQSIVRKLHNTISMWPAANLILLRDKEPFLCILSSRWLLIR